MEAKNSFLPPASNTGVTEPDLDSDRIETRIDWVQGSLPDTYYFELIEFLAELLGTGVDFFTVANHGTRWFTQLTHGPCGVAIESGHRTGSGLMCVRFPGEFFKIEGEKQYKLIKFLYQKQFKCTRLDLDADDYGWRLSPERVMTHCADLEKFKVTGFRRSTYKIKSRYSEKFQRMGYTVEFGNRGNKGGLKQFVIYDKEVESDGELNCCRCELRLYDLKANIAFQVMAQSFIEEWSSLIMGFIKGAISFFVMDEDENKITCNWWSQIFEDFDAWTLPSKPRSNPSMSKALNYLKKQVAPTLSMLGNIITYLGEPGEFEAFIYSLWDNGAERLNDKQKLIQKSIQAQFAEGSGWDFFQWCRT